jgi:hypothetical protein
MSVYSRLVTTVLLALLASTATAESAWPTMPAPPQSSVAWVSDNMRINGVATRVQTFHSSLASAEVLAHFRREWGADGGRFVENEVGGFRVVGRREANHYLTVQTRDSAEGGSSGYIAVSEFTATPVAPAFDFPRPAGSETLSLVESHDTGRSATTFLFRNRRSVAENSQYYRRTLRNQRWRELAMQAATQGGGRVAVMRFDRPRESAQIVIQYDKHGDTIVTVNWEQTT